MMFQRGQDVIVNYRGVEHQGVVVNPTVRHGDLLCRILIDPNMDYGRITATLGLISYVNVHLHDVRPA